MPSSSFSLSASCLSAHSTSSGNNSTLGAIKDLYVRVKKKPLKLLGIRASLPLPSLWEAAAQLLVYFLVEDYSNYWIHRWMHSPWAYDKIHHVHHEFTAPVGINAIYAHWADVVLQGLSIIIGPAFVPCHVLTLCVWVVLLQVQTVETHCGYDFPWSPNKFIPFYGGAEYHDYHHYVGKSQSNFASVFTYCDYIYGTDKGYRYRKACIASMKNTWSAEGNANISGVN